MFFPVGIAVDHEVRVIGVRWAILGHPGERRGVNPPVGPNESTGRQRNRNQTNNCNSDVHRVVVLRI
jgi:hypothetical protein